MIVGRFDYFLGESVIADPEQFKRFLVIDRFLEYDGVRD